MRVQVSPSAPMKIPLIIIVGPTATGKSDLAVHIARSMKDSHGKPRGEVISADSRQVYKGLDIGTGKITKSEMKGIAHHLLDVADPRIPANSTERFNVEKWQSMATQAIAEIHTRGHLPIICGGTGFYIEALVDGVILPEVPPNPSLRTKLEKKSAAQLFAILTKIDPKRAQAMLGKIEEKIGTTKKIVDFSKTSKSNGDWQNPRRIIRAIEIATALGAVPTISKIKKTDSPYSPVFIGLTLPPEELKKKITTRLEKRLKHGMLAEVIRLHKSISNGGGGLSWKRMEELGLEYRYLARYLQDASRTKSASEARELYAKMIETLAGEIWQYARRQMTWFRRDARIHWFIASDLKQKQYRTKDLTKVLNMVKYN